jgi:hypothetical protein
VTEVAARKAWARALIARAPDAPLYGSPEFLALPDGPEKVSSVCKAAESYLTSLEDEMARLRAQAEFTAKITEDLEWSERADAHRREWSGRGFRRNQAIAAEVEREWRNWASA